MTRLLAAAGLLLAALPVAAQTGNLYVVVAIDDFIPNEATLTDEQKQDYDIAMHVRADASGLFRLFHDNLPAGNREFITLSRAKATKQGLYDAIDRLPLKPGVDALLVTVHCHGGAAAADEDAHVLALKGGGVEVQFKRRELRDRMLAKKARFTALVTDACAFLPAGVLPSGRPPPPPPKDDDEVSLSEVVREPFKSLFFAGKGVVDINACREGTAAWSDSEGGVFSRSLIAALSDARTAGKPLTWPALYHDTRTRTQGCYGKFRGVGLDSWAARAVRRPLDSKEQGEYDVLKHQLKQEPQAYLLPGLRLGVTVRGTDGAGVEVTNIALDSPARKVLRVGDVVVKVVVGGGVTPTPTTGDWKAVVTRALDAGETRLGLVVQGPDNRQQTRTVELTAP